MSASDLQQKIEVVEQTVSELKTAVLESVALQQKVASLEAIIQETDRELEEKDDRIGALEARHHTTEQVIVPHRLTQAEQDDEDIHSTPSSPTSRLFTPQPFTLTTSASNSNEDLSVPRKSTTVVQNEIEPPAADAQPSPQVSATTVDTYTKATLQHSDDPSRSDHPILPSEVLTHLRGQIPTWDKKPLHLFRKTRLKPKLTCAQCRVSHKVCQWSDGPELACQRCQVKGKVCAAIKVEHVRLMPRLVFGPRLTRRDTAFWMTV